MSKLVLNGNDSSSLIINTDNFVGSKVIDPNDMKYIRDTIKDLSDLDGKLVDGDIVFIKGYHEVNDGGEGTFVYSSVGSKEDHNGGTVIDTSKIFPNDWNDENLKNNWFNINNTGTGVLNRFYNESIDVSWFGAKGDGATNDTLAVQSAIDYCSSKELYFDTICKVTSQLILPQLIRLKSNSKIEGGGGGIYSTASSIFGSVLPASTNWTYALFDLENITIKGSSSSTQQFMTLNSKVSLGWGTFRGCYFVNIFNYDFITTGILIESNNFQNVIHMEIRWSDATFTNNYIGFINNTGLTTNSDGLVTIASASSMHFTDNYISSFPVGTNIDAPIPLLISGSRQISLVANRLDGGSLYSLSVIGGSSKVVALANKITSITTGQPIWISNSQHINISDNYVNGLTQDQYFAGGNSTLKDIVLKNNITNDSVSTGIHRFVDNSYSTSDIRLTGEGLYSYDFTGTIYFSSSQRDTMLINKATTGTQTIYIYSENFKAGDVFYVNTTASGGISQVYDVTNAATVYNSSTSGVPNPVKIYCAEDGIVTYSAY